MTDEIGATGKFPDGKLGEDDEGEILFRVGHNSAETETGEGVVLVEFAKPVAWLGMPPKVARNLAALLTKHADAVEGEQVAGGEANPG